MLGCRAADRAHAARRWHARHEQGALGSPSGHGHQCTQWSAQWQKPTAAPHDHLSLSHEPHYVTTFNNCQQLPYIWGFFPIWVSTMNYLQICIILLYLVESWDSCCLAAVWHFIYVCACSIHVFRWCFTGDNNQNPSSVWDTGGTHNEGLIYIMQICCRNSVYVRILTLTSTIFENRSAAYIEGERGSNPSFQDWRVGVEGVTSRYFKDLRTSVLC